MREKIAAPEALEKGKWGSGALEREVAMPNIAD
jgi:hypothetical protein